MYKYTHYTKVSINLIISVSNSLGKSLWVLVQIKKEHLFNWCSRSSIHLNCPFRYCLMELSQPVLVGRVCSWLPIESIGRVIYCFCLCCVIIVSGEGCKFNFEWSLCRWCAVCNSDNSGMGVSPSIFCIPASKGGHQFWYKLKCPWNASISEYATPKSVDPPLMLMFTMEQCRYHWWHYLKSSPLRSIWNIATSDN